MYSLLFSLCGFRLSSFKETYRIPFDFFFEFSDVLFFFSFLPSLYPPSTPLSFSYLPLPSTSLLFSFSLLPFFLFHLFLLFFLISAPSPFFFFSVSLPSFSIPWSIWGHNEVKKLSFSFLHSYSPFICLKNL